MVEVINMPRLSDTMEEGTVAKWLFKVGDKITEGDILAEIETDKATMEFESFYEGTLLHIGVQEGETVPVDVLLAIIGDKDEDISEIICRTIEEDSLRTDTLNTNLLGVINDPEFGISRANLIVQPILTDFGDDLSDKLIDSVVLTLKYDKAQILGNVEHLLKYGNLESTM